MPKSITIRDIDDDVRDELAARAASTGRSLQEYLRTKLTQIAHSPDSEVILARMSQAEYWKHTIGRGHPSSSGCGAKVILVVDAAVVVAALVDNGPAGQWAEVQLLAEETGCTTSYAC